MYWGHFHQKNTNAPAQRVDAILFDQPTKHLTSLVHSTGSNAQILHYVCQKDPEFIYWRKRCLYNVDEIDPW